jgi:hypothetical protein
MEAAYEPVRGTGFDEIVDLDRSWPDDPSPVMARLASQLPVSVVRCEHEDVIPGVSCFVEPGPGATTSTKSAPHLGLIRAVHFDGVVGRGRSFVLTSMARGVDGRPGIEEQKLPVQDELEAQAVGVGVRREIGRARKTDVEDGVQGALAGDQVPGVRENDKPIARGGRGEEVQEARISLHAVVEERKSTVRQAHDAQPALHSVNGAAQPGDRW